MAYIFHIVEKKLWEKIKQANNEYAPESLESDGFIHCSKADQILDVANHMFKNREHGELLLLKISEPNIKALVKHEAPFEFPMAEIFYPHIYGPLNLDAVEAEIDFPSENDGSFKLPKIL